MSSDNAANYEAVLADLKAKRDKIDAAISAIEELGGVTSSPGVKSATASQQTEEVRSDSFFGMSIPDASRKFLQMSKKPRSTPEICDALEKGGLTHSSSNFGNTVGSVLNRVDSTGGEIVKVGRGTWGIAEWYPGRRKNKKSNGSEPIDAEKPEIADAAADL